MHIKIRNKPLKTHENNLTLTHTHTHTHTHRFNSPLSGTTRASRYQKGKTDLDFTEAKEAVASAGPYASQHLAPESRQITMPTPHRSSFYRPDARPAAQPTVSKH